jgi:hypothetical protein
MPRPMRNRRSVLRNLVKEFRVKDGNKLVLEVAEHLWAALDTPLSLGLSLLARNGQLKEVLEVNFDPSRYNDINTLRDDYQAISFLRKYPFPGFNREEPTMKKFHEAEEVCRRTNRQWLNNRSTGFEPDVEQVLHFARRKISYWLGTLNTSAWVSRCRFGPGADSLNRGTRVSAYHKLSSLSATADFSDGARALAWCHPSWARSLSGLSPEDHGPVGPPSIENVSGNRVTLVPKTALVDRSIAIEPQMNIFAQLGLGALIRSRLKRVGLDLDDQTPNMELARQGSIDGTVATIDLSMASDTLATEVVRDLVPDPWFAAMDWVRSKNGSFGSGDVFSYQKFSSMGNGFTFELESMIFYALALGCTKDENHHLVRSFGDDITVPTDSVELLVKVLGACGFQVNTQKSFTSGDFRESCGADFFRGINVRPYFHKELISDAKGLFRLVNGIRRVAYRRNCGIGCDRRLRAVWVHVLARIPKSLRDITIPCQPRLGISWADLETGDGGLVVNHDEAHSSPFVTFNRDLQVGWSYARIDALPQLITADDWPTLITYGLYVLGQSERESRDGSSEHKKTSFDKVVGRGSVRSRLNFTAYSRDWFELGPWV